MSDCFSRDKADSLAKKADSFEGTERTDTRSRTAQKVTRSGLRQQPYEKALFLWEWD